MKMVDHLAMQMESNMPFIESSFKKSMEKTVSQGKAEIEAYIQGKVTALGLKALEDFEAPELIEQKAKED